MEDQRLVERLGGDTQELRVTQHPPPEDRTGRQMRGEEVRLWNIPLQVGEEGIRYYLCSSSCEPKDGEGSVEGMSFGSDGEDLNDGSMGGTDRGAQQPHAPQAPSPIPESEYTIALEEPNGQETRKVEDLDMVGRSGGETQGFQVPQHPPLEAQVGEQGNQYILDPETGQEATGHANKR